MRLNRVVSTSQYEIKNQSFANGDGDISPFRVSYDLSSSSSPAASYFVSPRCFTLITSKKKIHHIRFVVFTHALTERSFPSRPGCNATPKLGSPCSLSLARPSGRTQRQVMIKMGTIRGTQRGGGRRVGVQSQVCIVRMETGVDGTGWCWGGGVRVWAG